MRDLLVIARCCICHKPSGWDGECCERCMYAPAWQLWLRHPLRCWVTGILYALGVIDA